MICLRCIGAHVITRPYPRACPACNPSSHVLAHEARKTRTSAATCAQDGEIGEAYTLAGHLFAAAAERRADEVERIDLIAEGAIMYDLAGRRDLGRAMIARFGYTDRRGAIPLPVPASWMDVDELSETAEMPSGVLS